MKRASILLALSFLFIYGCSKETETTIDSSNENLNQVTLNRGHGGDHPHGGGGGGGGNNGGGGNGGNDVLFDVEIIDPVGFNPINPTLVSTCDGNASSNKPSITWPRPTVIVCVEITPDPIVGEISVTLMDDPGFSVGKQAGKIKQIQFFIQDIDGPDGIQYSSDPIVFNPTLIIDPTGFTIEVRTDFISVYRHSGHTGGPKVLIGHISIGDIVYTPSPSQ